MIARLRFDSQVTAIVEDCVQFADESPKPEKGQLLENVFPDPRGFGIAEDGRCAGGSQQAGVREVGDGQEGWGDGQESQGSQLARPGGGSKGHVCTCRLIGEGSESGGFGCLM